MCDFNALMKRASDFIQRADTTDDPIAREQFLGEAEQLLSIAEQMVAPSTEQEEIVH